MSEDKELVEVWRNQFEKWFIGDLDIKLKRDEKGNYTFMGALSAWNSWLASKKSQPVLELTKPVDMYDSGGTWEGRYYHDKTIYNALTAAGIKYTIGE